MLCLVCIPCIKGQNNYTGHMPTHCHLPMLYTVVGKPDTAAGSTSSSASATVPPVQSSAQQPTSLTSGQQPSMQQAPPSHQGQQSQMPITSEFQQPTGMLSNVLYGFRTALVNCKTAWGGSVCVCVAWS